MKAYRLWKKVTAQGKCFFFFSCATQIYSKGNNPLSPSIPLLWDLGIGSSIHSIFMLFTWRNKWILRYCVYYTRVSLLFAASIHERVASFQVDKTKFQMQICTLLDVNTYVTNFYTYKKKSRSQPICLNQSWAMQYHSIYHWKKPAYKWTRAVETCIFQGSPVLYFFLKSLRVCCLCSDVRLPPQWVIAAPPLPSSPTKRNFSQGQGGMWFSVSKKVQGNTFFTSLFLWSSVTFSALLSSKTPRQSCVYALYWIFLFSLLNSLQADFNISLFPPHCFCVQVCSSSPATLATLLFLKHSRWVLPSGLFHWPDPLPGTYFSQGLLSHPLKSLLKYYHFIDTYLPWLIQHSNLLHPF